MRNREIEICNQLNNSFKEKKKNKQQQQKNFVAELAEL